MTDFPFVNEKHTHVSLLPPYYSFLQRLIADNCEVVPSSTEDHFLKSSICLYGSRVCFQSQKNALWKKAESFSWKKSAVLVKR